MDMRALYLVVPLAPLVGAIVVGLFGPQARPRASRTGCASSASPSSMVASYLHLARRACAGNVFNGDIYTWLQSGIFKLSIGFLIDPLTATMMLVVTFVSLMVHVYTIGYMADDPGYTRFFSYISLFTFSMLMLVMSNNFLQLFFGWEAVGLVSYLLIGFWYDAADGDLRESQGVSRQPRRRLRLRARHRPRARVLRHARLRAASSRGPPSSPATTINLWGAAQWSLMSVICICLFIGAMGKSAQVPLHVWLPDSMEGPTPISALIHAATMVTAGIFMVARMSPLFELSDTALSVRHDHRRDHRAVHGVPRHRPERHQARRRLFDAVAARLHDGRARRLGLRRWRSST